MNLQQEYSSYNNEHALYLQAQYYLFTQDLLLQLRWVCFTHFVSSTLNCLLHTFKLKACKSTLCYTQGSTNLQTQITAYYTHHHWYQWIRIYKCNQARQLLNFNSCLPSICYVYDCKFAYGCYHVKKVV
jgi:hypothetical protein